MVYIERGQVFPEKPKVPAGDGGSDSSEIKPTVFKSWVRRNPSGPSDLPAEAGRYHLLVSLACPFSHRAIIMRSLKGLQAAVPMTVLHPLKDNPKGWHFVGPEGDERYPECRPDTIGLDARFLTDVYLASDKDYTGRVSVPVLWDTKTGRVVSNESGDISEMLNSEFEEHAKGVPVPDYYPPHLRSEIDAISDWLGPELNMGVYRTGFATTQEDYEAACRRVFAALDRCESILAKQRYLVSYYPPGASVPSPTLADVRLFATLIRFDIVYYGLFKCMLRRIADYPNLQTYMEDLYSNPSVATTVSFPHIKDSYYFTFVAQNPAQLVPRGGAPFTPEVSFCRRKLGVRDSAQPQESNGSPAAAEASASGGAYSHGAFVRPDSKLRNWITADGSSGFKAEAGRYHLYIANNCPWCHRCVLTRALLGLHDVISMDVLFYRRDPDKGWVFNPGEPGCTPDTVAGGIGGIRELYARAGSAEKSVPVLYDKQTATIVSNESADIIRMLATEFREFAAPKSPELVPHDLIRRIDEVNGWIYDAINNGAYKAGFAKGQVAYDKAFDEYFEALDRVECLLDKHRYLLGETLTEADVRLFPTLFRHDHVYFVRFKVNKAMLADSYPNTLRWLLDVYSLPGVKEASNFDHCIGGYFGRWAIPTVPLRPKLSYSLS
ncbi:hypothetical protein KFL_000860280 [Klebsormidium nitens]|uniref:GST C-terminal domain-containing protein n=1 Tax=Klebsormidium nitens TaxID=105231 RepID=A0A1Y1HYQ1_KLENI|nr:hypothetical protein KFL_000860280 [Klebsormidium nitens]|eukprot:GAQ81656.1 hypothetical protein KFL_000860280 [Klebsormidium nitens]